MRIDRELVARALARAPHVRISRILPSDPPPAPAGVAVPIAFEPEPTAFAVLRASTMRDHGGEVGFPGGKQEPDDEDLRRTALRELHEEVALADVDVLGALSPVPVITGRYLIHPIVVATRADARPTLASTEVEAILPIPIAPYFSGERPIHAVSGTFRGVTFTTPHFELDHPVTRAKVVLYGASAFVFYELLARVAAELDVSLPDPILVDAPPWGDRYARPPARPR